MANSLYFDCFAGASGDMILGALKALGLDETEFVNQLNKINVFGFKVDFKIVDRAGLSATKAQVNIPVEHAHRHLSEITQIINNSELSQTVKTRAVEIFNNLGRAEAKMHNVPLEKVHFHEVGAMDAIIDVVGACIGFEMLDVSEFYCSKIHVGSGMVKMAHGVFPVPPPAVAELLKNIPVYSTDIAGELITPTGAAIISTVCRNYGAIPEMAVEAVGYGAGSREYKDFPNVLRLMLGQTKAKKVKFADLNSSELKKSDDALIIENLILLETNVDDLSGQTAGYLLEKAFEENVLDCWFESIQMKKNRPATKISILCEKSEKEKFIELLFLETTTLGVRVQEIERQSLPREFVKVKTEFGEITIKIARFNNKIIKAGPEFEEVKAAAKKHQVSFDQVKLTAVLAFERKFKGFS